MGERGQDPADGVGDVEYPQIVVSGENGIDPHHTEAAGADESDDHGHDRAAHPADDIRHNIHNGIQTVGGTDDHHTDHAHGNNFRILIVESKQRIAKAVGDKAENLRKEDAQGQAPKGDAPQALVLPGAEILTGEGEGSLRHRIAAGKNEAFDIDGGGITGHGGAAEGIDGGLDEDIGDGEDGTLQTGGDADLEDTDEFIPVDAQLLEDDVVAAVGFQHAPQHQRGGDMLRNNGGNADARHTEIELDDQKQVEADIDDAGEEKEDQGSAGIAHAAQYRRTKVIQHTAWHPQKVDA